MNTQVSNPEYSPWLHSLLNFSGFLKENAQFLSKLDAAAKKMGFHRFPITPFSKIWQRLTTMSEQRIHTYSKKPQSEAIFSNIFYWAAPELAVTYVNLRTFGKAYCQGTTDGKIVNPVVLQETWQELIIAQRFNLAEVRVDGLLEIPSLLMERLMTTASELASCFEQRLQRLKAELADRTDEPYLNMMSFLEIQARYLQLGLAQISSAVMAERDDLNCEKDSSVIKFNYVMRQYDLLVAPEKMVVRRFLPKIRLIAAINNVKKRIRKFNEDRRINIFLLIKGEENYIQGLTEYIVNIKQPIQRLGLLSKDQARLLFSSIVEIRALHEDILALFQKQFDNYAHEQCYGNIFLKIIPYFKVYTDYILNAAAAQNYMKHLMVSEKAVAEICRTYTTKFNKNAENQLLQPTFRIARYQMLFQQIIKKTSKKHPDYTQLVDVNAAFKKMLTQVNNQVDRIMRRMKLNDLDREFGSLEQPIYTEKREYLNQFTVSVIREPNPQPVMLFVLSDLLLVVEEPSRKLIKTVPVNEDFFARREEDNKIYRNMVTVHSDGFMTFTFGSDDLLSGKANQLFEVLRSITNQSGQLVFIQVLGTEEIGSTSFAKYTEYIVEVKYLDVKKLLHVRFSTIADMVALMQGHYQDSLKITEEESLRKSWFNSHKSKTIEARKRIICQILQRLFNHPIIRANPQYFLRYLSLPDNFFDVARKSYEKRISVAQTVTLSRLKRSYLTRKEERQAFTILCGTEIRLGRDLFHDDQHDEQLKKLKETAKNIQIRVITLDQEEPNLVRITEYDTVQDVCNRLSKLMGLRSNRDFRLFHEIGKKELRVLEHEQIITKLFKFPQEQPVQKGFYSSLKKLVFADTHPTLIFKKYYYLPYDIEQAEMRKDLIRLRLMTFQVFAEVKDMKYQLTFDEYLLFLALRAFINAEGKVDQAIHAPPEIVHSVIPENIFKLKNYSEQQWLQKCKRHILRLSQEITRVSEHNRQQFNLGKLQADSVSKQNLYFGPKYLCSQVVLNKIKTNPLFGSNLFYVQPHNATYAKLQQKGLKVSFNMWLAVSFNSLQLLSPSSKESVFELKYEDVGKTEVFSEAIVLRTSGAIEEEYRLNTYQSFEISQLVKYNQALNDILVNLKEDSELNSRVKQYRDQLIQYRSTFNDEHQQPISLIRD